MGQSRISNHGGVKVQFAEPVDDFFKNLVIERHQVREQPNKDDLKANHQKDGCQDERLHMTHTLTGRHTSNLSATSDKTDPRKPLVDKGFRPVDGRATRRCGGTAEPPFEPPDNYQSGQAGDSPVVEAGTL